LAIPPQKCGPWCWPGAVFLFIVFISSNLIWADALQWQTGVGFRSAPLPVPRAGKTGFTLLPAGLTGIDFTNRLAESHSLTNHILLNGSGVAAGDVDGDGLCDLYFCSLDGPNVLYRNLGNWKFQDITAAAGVACEGQYSTGAAFADVDGDGDLDLLVNSIGGGTRCFLNNGKGRFSEVTAAAGLASHTGSMSMALGDIDGDGDLDLYVANYRTSTMRDTFSMRIKVKQIAGRSVITAVNGRPVTAPDLVGRFTINEAGAIVENGEADVLYTNDGRGHFAPVSFTDGSFLDEEGKPLASPPYDWGLSVMFRDLNGDGAPDIYVCNDLDSVDRIWINSGTGRFQAIRRLAMRKTSLFSMGVDFADLNRDGHDEIFVADMLSRDHQKRHTQENDHKSVVLPIGQIDNRPSYARNTLFLNHGDGDYSEIAYFSGVSASDWSWCPIFLDVDLDGYEDILISTGFERDVQDIDIAGYLEKIRREKDLADLEALNQRKMFPRLDPPNVAFRNKGDMTFEEVGRAWGFDLRGVSQGMALADLDNDGDLDVVINNLNGAAAILRNDSPAPRVAVRLKGRAPNTRGIGAKITLTGGPVPQSQEMICGGRYLSCDDTFRVFAAGNGTNDLSIEVIWRSGTRSVVKAQPNHLYEIDEAEAQPWHRSGSGNGKPKDQPAPLFQDVSHLISHSHHENNFDDFARQPLLPKRLSQLGPGVAWCDLDGDGHDDLLVASGQGGELAAFRNDRHGGFNRIVDPPFTGSVARDQTSVLAWAPAHGKTSVLVGSSNYEDGLTNGESVLVYDLERKSVVPDDFGGCQSSTGPLALADLDGNGEWALFVGGRTVPGRYPEAATSKLYRYWAGHWRLDEKNTRQFEQSGMVSGAVFSDLDGDGYPDLVLVGEWQPVRVFLNRRGTFKEATAELGLASYVGWWNGVTTADLDGDGRLDIVASNWGRNSKYKVHAEQPQRIYYGDFAEDGGVQIVQACFDAALGKLVPWETLDRIEAPLPFVRQRLPSFRAYSAASVAEILGARMKIAKELRANWFDSTVFLNREDHFEPKPLPMEAQLSPAFAVCVADMDGDGKEDIFLSQNFFATDARTGRYDGGRGLWLRGDGKGGFNAIPAKESGLKIYGEQRGAALGDYDGDGRIDLVVAQNGAETKLYKNVGARPGLRVRLSGQPGNPDGIGATLRMITRDTMGPAREVHAGSGYWSQDSAVQVLAMPDQPAQLWVRWPGGKTATAAVPKGAREVRYEMEGSITVLKSE